MNAKLLLSFLFGLIFGGVGVYFLGPRGKPPAEMKAKVARLEAELVQKQTALKEFQAKSAVVDSAESQQSAEKIAEQEQQQARMKAQMERQRQVMKKKVEARLAAKVDEQLAVLTKKLGLTDEQVADVRKLLMDKLLQGDFGLMAMNAMGGEGDDSSGKNREREMMEMMLDPQKQEKAMNEKLLALLTPDQQQGYAAHQQEQRANKVEMATNKELAKLQGAMSLTSEQKDQIFATLSQFADQEHDKPIPGMIAMFGRQAGEIERVKKEVGDETAGKMLGLVDELKQRQAQRREALAPILSGEQMKVYENLQQSSAFDMSEMMGDMGMDVMMMNAEEAGESAAPENGIEVPPADR